MHGKPDRARVRLVRQHFGDAERVHQITRRRAKLARNGREDERAIVSRNRALHFAQKFESAVARHLEVGDHELRPALLGDDAPRIVCVVNEHGFQAFASYNVTIEIDCL
jgi:hypothetical protein